MDAPFNGAPEEDDGVIVSPGIDVILGLPRNSSRPNLGLGAGEFLARDEETVDTVVSDLAGDGLIRTGGASNLAGLAELDGIVIGLELT